MSTLFLLQVCPKQYRCCNFLMIRQSAFTSSDMRKSLSAVNRADYAQDPTPGWLYGSSLLDSHEPLR